MKKLKRGTLSVGETVLNNKYEVIKLLHTTGMANVYLVQDNSLGKNWCMKEIRKSQAGKNKIEYYSLLQEANIMKGLNHASIPRIVTIEQEDDSIFIVMDYVDGMSIKDWMSRNNKTNGRVPQDVAVDWMKQICKVMMYLHNRKYPIFYRDMKPDNVMIQSDGNIKLLDFGVSVVIKEPNQKIKKALGTQGFAAPEQSKRGNVCDLRSDIYAMGKTLYYMLTGINPNLISEDKQRAVREIDSSISVGLERIIIKCCQKNPDDRYQSCEELMYDLQNYTKLDTEYRSKIRRKIYCVFGMFLTGVFLLITSMLPFGMYKNKKLEEYKTLYSIAERSGRLEDYISVLNSDATKIEPYDGLIESIKVDGIFSKEEEQLLLNYINPNLEVLKKSDKYGKLSYEVGKLYWFFYDGDEENDGMIISTKWFKDAINDGYESELSSVYYQLGSFKKNISASITESSDAGMYSKYWNNLISAKSKDNGEMVNLQLNLSIANCISSYTYNLKTDGISYNDVTSQVNELKQFTEQYTPSIEKAMVSYDKLVTTLEGLQEKVDKIYKGGI